MKVRLFTSSVVFAVATASALALASACSSSSDGASVGAGAGAGAEDSGGNANVSGSGSGGNGSLNLGGNGSSQPGAAGEMSGECTAEFAAAELRPVHLAFAFDVSGSMGKLDEPYHDPALKWRPVVAATRAFFEDRQRLFRIVRQEELQTTVLVLTARLDGHKPS